jgi:hypothetical protein
MYSSRGYSCPSTLCSVRGRNSAWLKLGVTIEISGGSGGSDSRRYRDGTTSRCGACCRSANRRGVQRVDRLSGWIIRRGARTS